MAGREHRRWLAIWNGLVDPQPASEVAIHRDVSVSTVHNVVSQDSKFDRKAIEGREDGTRHRCYLTKDQQALSLKPFLEIAPKGEIGVAGRIKQALEELLGHAVYHSTVCRMLHRNGWRESVSLPRVIERYAGLGCRSPGSHTTLLMTHWHYAGTQGVPECAITHIIRG